MMRNSMIACCLTLSFLQAGCASVKVAEELKLAEPKKGMATAYFYREDTFYGSFVNWKISEKSGSKPLGTLKNASYFFTYLQPGEHTFVIDGDESSGSTVTMKPNQTYYFQCRKDMGATSNHVRMSEVTANEGLKAVQSKGMSMTVN
jgi:hypothetical protein